VESFISVKFTVSATFKVVDLGGRGGGDREGVAVVRLCNGGGGGPNNGGPAKRGSGPADGEGDAASLVSGLGAGETGRFIIPRVMSGRL